MTEQNKEDNRDCLCRNWLGSCTLSAVAVILVYIVAKDLLSTAWNLQILTNGKKQNIVRMLVFKVQSNVIESSFGELGCKIIKRDSRPSRPFPPLFERGKLQKSCPSFPNFKTLFLSYYLWSSWWPQLSLFLRYSAHDPWNSPKSEIILSRQVSVTTRLPSEPLSVGGNLTQPRQKQEAKHEK